MKTLFTKETFDPKLVRPMSNFETEMMFKSLILEQAGAMAPRRAAELFTGAMFEGVGEAPGITRIMVARLQAADPELEYYESTLLFLDELSDGRPGNAVMWAWSLFKETSETGRPISIHDLARDLCPFGFPTEQVLRETWDSQKITPAPGTLGDNWLDTAEAWR